MQSEKNLALKQQLELYVERVQDSDPRLQKVGLESMRNLAGEIAQEYRKRQSEEAAIEDLLELVQ
ncbi:26S proteasome non-ATPase regulatory subunit 2 1A -like protein [Gossypium arboreum]|uniref:26S proteasome non-ATPase regulatory subunit 2 1A-like protein n=1 Tax=Gossypium arboreum TaxID=29729 RepID=A0A0B0MXJ1_GOSAR|nr:26S proteasome non-ATPase regulatory subunit 2 1A -like protein [Gossypium arboreum]